MLQVRLARIAKIKQENQRITQQQQQMNNNSLTNDMFNSRELFGPTNKDLKFIQEDIKDTKDILSGKTKKKIFEIPDDNEEIIKMILKKKPSLKNTRKAFKKYFKNLNEDSDYSESN